MKKIGHFYVLHVDRVGEYAMKNAAGERCMLAFTTKDSVTQFIERMEMPEHKEFTAIELAGVDMKIFLEELQKTTQLIAFDPYFDDELVAVRVENIILDL